LPSRHSNGDGNFEFVLAEKNLSACEEKAHKAGTVMNTDNHASSALL